MIFFQLYSCQVLYFKPSICFRKYHHWIFDNYLLFIIVAVFENSNLNHNHFTKIFLDSYKFYEIIT